MTFNQSFLRSGESTDQQCAYLDVGRGGQKSPARVPTQRLHHHLLNHGAQKAVEARLKQRAHVRLQLSREGSDGRGVIHVQRVRQDDLEGDRDRFCKRATETNKSIQRLMALFFVNPTIKQNDRTLRAARKADAS